MTDVVGGVLMCVPIVVIYFVVVGSVAVSLFGIVSGNTDDGCLEFVAGCISVGSFVVLKNGDLVGILVEPRRLTGGRIFYLCLLA